MINSSPKNQKKNNNKTTRSKTSSNFYRNTKKITENQLAIEDAQKYYQVFYENPNPLFTSQLKKDKLNIFLNVYKINDMIVMSKILNKYKFFKTLIIAPFDPKKKHPKTTRRNEREPITEGEKVKLAKQKKDQKIEYMNMVNKITLGIGRHLFLTLNLKELYIINFDIDKIFAQNLSKGINGNHSLCSLTINKCIMTIESYEILLKGLLNHEKIEHIDLKNNDLGDKYGNMVGRIIARQSYRRDQIIWLYGLRNEVPKNKDYTLGLISINLDGNKLSSYAADCITTSLASDQYIRSIILTNNEFDKNSCKKYIYMLRRNMTLLNIDLRHNPGYDYNIKIRIVMKMSKNIRNLYVQYKSNVFTEKEFQNLKKYIDTSFFNLNIPTDIVDYYNNKLLISEDYLNNNNKIKDKNNINNNRNKNKGISNIKEEEKVYSNSNISRYSLSPNYKKTKFEKFFKNNLKNNNSSENDNKNLKQENLLLKKKILELKAENLQKKLGKNLNVPKVFNMNNLNKNYKIADELFDKLNEIMNTIGNDKGKKNNDKNNFNKEKSEQIKKNNIKNIEDNQKIKEEKKDLKNNIKIINKENNIIKQNENKEYDIEKMKNKKNQNDIKDKNEKDKKGINEKSNNILNNNEDEEKDGELDIGNLEEEQMALLYHKKLYEQLKKQYEEKGEKFDIQDYMALYGQLEQEEEEDEGEEGF